MTNDQKTRKGKRIGYWVSTGLLALGMVAGGLGQILEAKWQVEGTFHLGYPLYFIKILGVWKLLGVAALLVPGYQMLKEWAYAGFFFLLTGATISHLAVGDPVPNWIGSFTLAILTVVSWRLRPADRKLNLTHA